MEWLSPSSTTPSVVTNTMTPPASPSSTVPASPDQGKILDAVNLNNLDDWTLFHAQEING